MNEKIDLSKYEGHTPGPWHYEMPPEEGMVIKAGNSHVAELSFLMSNMSPYTDDVNPTGLDPDAVDARLIADAPLLLAEVGRLRNHIRRMRHWAEPKMHEVHHDAWRKLHDEIYEGDEEE